MVQVEVEVEVGTTGTNKSTAQKGKRILTLSTHFNFKILSLKIRSNKLLLA